MNVTEAKKFVGAVGDDLSDVQWDNLAEIGSMLENLCDDEVDFSIAMNAALDRVWNSTAFEKYLSQFRQAESLMEQTRAALVGAVLGDSFESGESVKAVSDKHGITTELSSENMLGLITVDQWETTR